MWPGQWGKNLSSTGTWSRKKRLRNTGLVYKWPLLDWCREQKQTCITTTIAFPFLSRFPKTYSSSWPTFYSRTSRVPFLSFFQIFPQFFSWIIKIILYRAFHRFWQAKFPDNGSVLGSSQFSILSQLPQKILLDSKVVKIYPKIIISLC